MRISQDKAVSDAVSAAVLAPSVHNSQPWRFVATPAGLEIFADRARQLAVLDPSGRQLILSVGCALFNARVSLANSGTPVTIHRVPDPEQPDLLARVDIGSVGQVETELSAMDHAIPARRSNRRMFSGDDVPDYLIDTLTASAATEGAVLQTISTDDDRRSLARLSQRADDQQITNAAYRAELRSWTTTDPERRDGVQAAVIPHVDGTAHDEIPLRDFDTRGEGALPANTQSSSRQCLLLLGTDGDGPRAWLRAGEALERMWLELTRAGFAASLFTQVMEEPGLRAQLRDELRLGIHPHAVLRVGRAPITEASPRRAIADVLCRHGDPCTGL